MSAVLSGVGGSVCASVEFVLFYCCRFAGDLPFAFVGPCSFSVNLHLPLSTSWMIWLRFSSAYVACVSWSACNSARRKWLVALRTAYIMCTVMHSSALSAFLARVHVCFVSVWSKWGWSLFCEQFLIILQCA